MARVRVNANGGGAGGKPWGKAALAGLIFIAALAAFVLQEVRNYPASLLQEMRSVANQLASFLLSPPTAARRGCPAQLCFAQRARAMAGSRIP